MGELHHIESASRASRRERWCCDSLCAQGRNCPARDPVRKPAPAPYRVRWYEIPAYRIAAIVGGTIVGAAVLVLLFIGANWLQGAIETVARASGQ